MTVRTIDEIHTGRTYTEILITERPGGTLALPIAVLKGDVAGPTLLVTAGIHPTEYAGIDAALRLSNTVGPEEVRGTIVVLPFVNLAGFNSRMPGGSQEDMVDIWRAFPGTTGSSIANTIANEVFQKLVLRSDFVVDLHGGELNESEAIPLAWYSETGNAEVDVQSRRLADAFGPDYL